MWQAGACPSITTILIPNCKISNLHRPMTTVKRPIEISHDQIRNIRQMHRLLGKD